MRRAEELLGHIINDNYLEKEYDSLIKKYPHHFEFEKVDDITSRFKKRPKKEEQAWSRYSGKYIKEENKTWDELWDLLKKELRHWWD